MKRFITTILAAAVMLGCFSLTAAAEDIITYGPFTYDAADADEVTHYDGYSILTYQDHLLLLRYIPLASEGFDQELFDAVLETTADSDEIAYFFLEELYLDGSDDPFYEDFAIAVEPDTYTSVSTELYTGYLEDDGELYPMAGICVVDTEGVMMVEAISVFDTDPASAAGFRSAAVSRMTRDGKPMFSAVEGDILYMGSFAYDLSGCDSYTLDGSYLTAEYGSRTVCLEHAYFPEFGSTFEKIASTLGTFTYRSMAELFFEVSDYVDYENTIYKACKIDETDIVTWPEGIMFSGVLDDEYGYRRVSGFILVTDEELIFQHCIDYELGASIASTESFRRKILGWLSYEGAPVIK